MVHVRSQNIFSTWAMPTKRNMHRRRLNMMDHELVLVVVAAAMAVAILKVGNKNN